MIIRLVFEDIASFALIFPKYDTTNCKLRDFCFHANSFCFHCNTISWELISIFPLVFGRCSTYFRTISKDIILDWFLWLLRNYLSFSGCLFTCYHRFNFVNYRKNPLSLHITGKWQFKPLLGLANPNSGIWITAPNEDTR